MLVEFYHINIPYQYTIVMSADNDYIDVILKLKSKHVTN